MTHQFVSMFHGKFISFIKLKFGKRFTSLIKMQLDVEMSPPANNVWHLNSEGSSSALGKLIDIATPSQVSNFATRGASMHGGSWVPKFSQKFTC